MGMYDSFFAPVTCPNCGTFNPMQELQTKDGECEMARVGVGGSTKNVFPLLQTGIVKVVLYCGNKPCYAASQGKRPMVNLYIKDYIFVGTTPPSP